MFANPDIVRSTLYASSALETAFVCGPTLNCKAMYILSDLCRLEKFLYAPETASTGTGGGGGARAARTASDTTSGSSH